MEARRARPARSWSLAREIERVFVSPKRYADIYIHGYTKSHHGPAGEASCTGRSGVARRVANLHQSAGTAAARWSSCRPLRAATVQRSARRLRGRRYERHAHSPDDAGAAPLAAGWAALRPSLLKALRPRPCRAENRAHARRGRHRQMPLRDVEQRSRATRPAGLVQIAIGQC